MVFEKMDPASAADAKTQDVKLEVASKDGKQLAEDIRYRLRVLLRDGLDGPSKVFDDSADYLYSTCISIAKRNKDDLRVPFRVLKEEIGRSEYNSEASIKDRQVQLLFRLYDALEEQAGDTLRDTEHPDQMQAALLFEELRTRMLRLVVGETWDDATRLRGMALKKIHAYKMKERNLRRSRSTVQRSNSTGTENKLQRALSKRLSTSSAVVVGTWEDTMEEMAKVPASKLFPLIKLLLVEVGDADVLSKSSSVDEPETPGARAKGPGRTVSDVTEAIAKVTVDDLLDMHNSPDANHVNGHANGHHPHSPAVNGQYANGSYANGHANGYHTPPPAPAPTAYTLSSNPHADPWQAAPVPVQAPLQSYGSMSNGVQHGYGAPVQYNNAPVQYNTVQPDYSPQYATQTAQPQYAAGFGQYQLQRSTSSASEQNGSQSPYLGKKDPLKDTTFADLSPL